MKRRTQHSTTDTSPLPDRFVVPIAAAQHAVTANTNTTAVRDTEHVLVTDDVRANGDADNRVEMSFTIASVSSDWISEHDGAAWWNGRLHISPVYFIPTWCGADVVEAVENEEFVDTVTVAGHAVPVEYTHNAVTVQVNAVPRAAIAEHGSPSPGVNRVSRG